MEREQIQKKWEQYKGKAKQGWLKLTQDDWLIIQGDKDVLLTKLGERYGFGKDRAEKELTTFLSACSKGYESKKISRPLYLINLIKTHKPINS